MLFYFLIKAGSMSCIVTRHSIVKLILLLFLLTNFGELNAQETNLFLTNKDGSQTYYELSNISKLTFENGNLLVEQNDGEVNSYALGTLRNLMFNELISVNDPKEQYSDHFKIYPNPSDDFIIIEQNTNDHVFSKIEIFDTEGKMIISKDGMAISNTPQTKIDISRLVQGTYVCRIFAEGGVFSQKFIKK